MPLTDPNDFETLYRQNPDPWNFAASPYEREKYANTLASLPPRRFRRGFEVGCSIGVLTQHLATRCDSLLAIDVSETALTQARRRCETLEHVTLGRMAIPHQWPQGSFDLIVFSEVLYYLDAEAIQVTARQTSASLDPSGLVLLVNWHGETGGTCSGDEAASRFIEATTNHFQNLNKHRTEKYRLDLLTRTRP